ncbi:orotidine-5'-phosphate decarboxylase [Brevibacterium sp. BRM-1]|uniref:orotidine-5'-phosphate decarboxylase n=1 Tax=Brevibacterium sp. BRM-1 TaxID=2999062 RepID=UPI00227DAB55|nr:orotidine-5'-phosphate decarboxylase [Brevibacterium sp. BRM-1]WAL40900.1 orotidine-5'-phosphate decarboxylase [Brevibacterium sp. BRM-1]
MSAAEPRRDFAAAWQAAAAVSPLCVGVDPHAAQLAAWGLPDTAAGAREFGLRLLDACARSGAARLVKPQSAFFERFGSAGIAVLEELLAAAREAGLVTILDVKRGDIGSTMAGYADAYMDPASPLCADALTLSPYLGVGALEPAFAAARAHGTGIFVLALTSNPDGARVQHARTPDGQAVAAEVARLVAAFDAQAGAPQAGLVVGATIGGAARELGIDLGGFPGPLLAPGYGAQGAGPAELADVFGAAFERGQVLVSASRSVSGAGPDAEALERRIVGLARAVRHDRG